MRRRETPAAPLLQVRNARTGRPLADRVRRTHGGWQGARGLLGRGGLAPGEALWIVGSLGVHSFGMRFPIDVLYLDGELRVLHALAPLAPNRLGPISLRCESVLELPAGTLAASGTRLGDALAFARRVEARSGGSPAEALHGAPWPAAAERGT